VENKVTKAKHMFRVNLTTQAATFNGRLLPANTIVTLYTFFKRASVKGKTIVTKTPAFEKVMAALRLLIRTVRIGYRETLQVVLT
jgi:hypothetical protein